MNDMKPQSQEPDNPVRDPQVPPNPGPAIPEPLSNEPDPYPVTDPVSEPNPNPAPFPTPPEPIPQYPPDVVF